MTNSQPQWPKKVVALPEERERLTAKGLTVGYMTLAQLANRELVYPKTWKRIIAESGFTEQQEQGLAPN